MNDNTGTEHDEEFPSDDTPPVEYVRTNEGQPDPGWPAQRLLVIGSEDFNIAEAIPRALVNWWIMRDRPSNVILVVADDNVGKLAYATWAEQQFPVELHETNLMHSHPTRDQWVRMTAIRPTHAFVFTVEGDAAVDARILSLAALGIPTTILTVSEMPFGG